MKFTGNDKFKQTTKFHWTNKLGERLLNEKIIRRFHYCYTERLRLSLIHTHIQNLQQRDWNKHKYWCWHQFDFEREMETFTFCTGDLYGPFPIPLFEAKCPIDWNCVNLFIRDDEAQELLSQNRVYIGIIWKIIITLSIDDRRQQQQ